MFHSVDYISDLIATNFLVRLNHKLVSFETFSGIFFPQGYRVIQISNLRCLITSSKFCFPGNFNLLSVFFFFFFFFQSGAPRCSHPHMNMVENLVGDSFPLRFYIFGPKIKHSIYNITTLKRRYTKVVSTTTTKKKTTKTKKKKKKKKKPSQTC